MPILNETSFLYGACICYGIGFLLIYRGRESLPNRSLLFFNVAGLLGHSVSLALRWV
jgi:hypothetical protein